MTCTCHHRLGLVVVVVLIGPHSQENDDECHSLLGLFLDVVLIVPNNQEDDNTHVVVFLVLLFLSSLLLVFKKRMMHMSLKILKNREFVKGYSIPNKFFLPLHFFYEVVYCSPRR
jgi:hypothetical protein